MQSLEAATTAERRQGKITAIASSAIHPSFHHQDEFTIADSITCFWYRFALPASLRPDSVEKIHQPPLGWEEATLRCSRLLVCWQGMSSQQKKMRHVPSQQKTERPIIGTKS